VVRRVYGLLLSTLEEWSQGTLQRVEDVFTAAAFDDLLDDADRFRRDRRHLESCVLSVTVLEHALRRIAAKQGVMAGQRDFDALVTALEDCASTGDAERELLAECSGLRRRIDQRGWADAAAGDIEAFTSCTRRLIEQFL
jgi:hypothetical protein